MRQLIRDEMPPPVTAGRRRLDALTSLRFFAAAMIVVHHLRGFLGIPQTFLAAVPLNAGVSFFFVLSGFVLTYAHPVLAMRDVPRFLLARAARLWPLYLAVGVLRLLLLPAAWNGVPATHRLSAFLHVVTLTQAWSTDPRIELAYNPVAWSLSCEAFFALCLPFLVVRSTRLRWLFFGASFVCIPAMIVLQALPHHPANLTVLVYVFPVARLFEFALGVTLAYIWRRCTVRPTREFATLLECGAVALIIFVLARSGGWAVSMQSMPWIGPVGATWLIAAGFLCLHAAFLIFIFAFEDGWISRLLRNRVSVVLGEASFALYLVHQGVLTWFYAHPGSFPNLTSRSALILFAVTSLAVSWILHRCIETPCRRYIIRLARPRSRAIVTREPIAEQTISV